MAERIFIVGHGAVTCLGPDMESTWQALISGRSGIRRDPELGDRLRFSRTLPGQSLTSSRMPERAIEPFPSSRPGSSAWP